jgi:Neuraminidase (sialidase)
MTSEYTYTIDTIGTNGYDVYVSDDGGYTWEYYESYPTLIQADREGANACERAMKNDE